MSVSTFYRFNNLDLNCLARLHS
ncbi:hypothetical protein Zm00014a_003450 [Zea mays]|uniref:Uncharacterized protein n=1 Tax=Zea mays TaxID=4577 RepID=A0A3L6EYE0_MAIZE|nr:hypothetical protein Zm00014a_003450 [Zea mays]